MILIQHNLNNPISIASEKEGDPDPIQTENRTVFENCHNPTLVD